NPARAGQGNQGAALLHRSSAIRPGLESALARVRLAAAIGSGHSTRRLAGKPSAMFRRAQGWVSGPRRRRRRLAWTAALAVVGGSVASIVVFVHEGGQSYSAGPARKGPAQVYKAPRTMRVTRRSLRSAEATVVAFLRTAVLREHVADSFD